MASVRGGHAAMQQNLLRLGFARTAGKVARQLAAGTLTASLVLSQGTATALAQAAQPTPAAPGPADAKLADGTPAEPTPDAAAEQPPAEMPPADKVAADDKAAADKKSKEPT